MNKDFVSSFHRVVRKYPNHTAIYDCERGSVTYQELWESALRLSLPKGDTIVGLQLARSADFVVGLLGIWAHRKTALILDPEWPKQRTKHILEVCGNPQVIRKLVFKTESSKAPRPLVDTNVPAYIIFTSGSTGDPKGVLVSHSGLCPVLNSQIESFRLDHHSRSFWIHGVAFDASISNIGTILLSGGTLCIDRDWKTETLCQSWTSLSISHVDLPPALLPCLCPEEAPASLKVLIVGGQVCDPVSVRKWAASRRIVNVYGPTEATICTSLTVCDENWDRPYIGKPVSGVQYQIDDRTGELVIIGDAVALKYVGNPELTKKRFGLSDGKRCFFSGDLVKQHPDGEIEFRGRLDRQFKLHGRLICPEEVEQAILTHSDVVDAYVFKNETNQLTACVVGGNSEDGLVRLLAESLPAWMIPDLWHFSTKIDRNKWSLPNNPALSVVDMFALALQTGEVDPELCFFEGGVILWLCSG